MSVEKTCYDLQENYWQIYAPGRDGRARAQTWLADDTVNAWRHQRMYDLLDPLIKANRGASWVTVGDGRFGKDARVVQSKDPAARVHATDISDMLLREAAATGYIKSFSRENAESLSFGDGEFDFVLCKESYHHFPRPMIALYEMIRVARTGVILMEPTDPYVTTGTKDLVFMALKRVVKMLLGRPVGREQAFEESGNYIYTVSVRELEKAAMGLQLPSIAWIGINDAYFEGVEDEKLAVHGPLYQKTQREIARLDRLTRIGLRAPGMLCVMLFKRDPGPSSRQALEGVGYQFEDMTRNPYCPQPDRGSGG